MDPFEVRMQFLHILHSLTASQHSIHKVVRYALKYYPKCGDDLWDCVVEECEKGTLNARVNILYMLDSLCEASLVANSTRQPSSGPPKPSTQNGPPYVEFVRKDLAKIVDMVVPDGREGLPNLMSTIQILESWRAKRIIEPAAIDGLMQTLDKRKEHMHDVGLTTGAAAFSRQEVFRRIEEDRERHKRLRERRWVQPMPPSSSMQATPAYVHRLACFLPPLGTQVPEPGAAGEDVEFENAWETTSDWNEDDDEDIRIEHSLWLPTGKGVAATRDSSTVS